MEQVLLHSSSNYMFLNSDYRVLSLRSAQARLR